jgi:hypothetical protein
MPYYTVHILLIKPSRVPLVCPKIFYDFFLLQMFQAMYRTRERKLKRTEKKQQQDDKFFQGLEHLLTDRNLLPRPGHGILFTTAVLHAVARKANSQREHFLLTVPTDSW